MTVPARKRFSKFQCKDASGDTSLLFNAECDADIRKKLYANFVPSGCTALFQADVERVTKEPTQGVSKFSKCPRHIGYELSVAIAGNVERMAPFTMKCIRYFSCLNFDLTMCCVTVFIPHVTKVTEILDRWENDEAYRESQSVHNLTCVKYFDCNSKIDISHDELHWQQL